MTRLFDAAPWEAGNQPTSHKAVEGSWTALSFVSGGAVAESLRCMELRGAASSSAYVYYELSEAKSDIWISGDVYLDHQVTGVVDSWYVNVRVGWDKFGSSDLGYVELDEQNQRINWSWSGSSGYVSFVVSEDTWYEIKIHVVVSAGGDEEVQVWVDGTKHIDWTGEASVTFSDIDRLYLYTYGDDVGAGWIFPNSLFDDFVVNSSDGAQDNGDPGAVRFVGLPPTSDGAKTDFDRGGVDSGDDWDQVDEIPPDGSEYLESDTPTEQSTFGFTGTPATIDGGAYSITGLHVVGRHKLSAAQDDAGIQPILHLGGSIDYGGSFDPGTAWESFEERWRQNPYAASAWTRATVDGMEGGMECM